LWDATEAAARRLLRVLLVRVGALPARSGQRPGLSRMTDRATANLPSADFDRTARFYAALGFAVQFKDKGWMILQRGALELEFFPLKIDPLTTIASACLRVDDLDALRSAFAAVGIAESGRGTPRLTPVEVAYGLRMLAVVDPDGNLLRCIDNAYRE
jgi:catechol 2,3-dioxygenase-like lactoylglutathione lyase family enzyme